MRRFLAVFLAVPMAARSTDLIKFESGKAALARDVNENFTRLDTAIQARATKGDLASLDAQIQVVRSIQSDSIQVISERIRRDSIALADFKAKIRKDSAATSADVKALQTTVTGLGSGGLPASAVAGKANSVAKFTGANAVGNSSLTDDGTNLSTAANLNVAGGSLKLSNASTNLLEFASVGLGLPTFGTRAKGAKVVWFGGLGATSTEYATGVNNYTLWNSVPMADADHNFAWYAGQTPVMTLKGVGTLDVASDIRTHGSMQVDGDLNVDNTAKFGSSLQVDGPLAVNAKVSFGGGVISMVGATNYIDFGQSGVLAPTSEKRSPGTKAVWYSQQGRYAGEVDYATGIAGSTLWNSVPLDDPEYSFKWFGGTKELMKLDGAGNMTLSGAINGKVVTRGIAASQVADYVFKPDYKLASLPEVEEFTQLHGHLPDVPSAREVEKNGLDLAEMNLVLLRKVEELTLHAIALQKTTSAQQSLIDAQRSELERQKARLDRLEAR